MANPDGVSLTRSRISLGKVQTLPYEAKNSCGNM